MNSYGNRYDGSENIVQSGGVVVGEIIDGTWLFNGGTSISNYISGAAIEYVGKAGTSIASGTSLSDKVGYGGALYIENGSYASATIIENGGSAYVDNGSTALGVTVSSGGVLSAYSQYNSGATLVSSYASSGGTVILGEGGTGYNNSADSGGYLVVSSGGTEIASAGTSYDVEIASGGSGRVIDGGYLVDAQISSGGYANIKSGSAERSVIHGGGIVDVADGGGAGVLSYSTILSGGEVYVHSGGTSISNYISSGAAEYVGKAGAAIANGTSLNDQVGYGGALYIENGSYAADTIIENGGTAYVDNGSVALGVTVSSGGVLSAYSRYNSGGTLVSSYVSSGGTIVLGEGGTSTSAIVANGGELVISPGGYASATTICSGGTVTINSEDDLIGTTLYEYGTIDFKYLDGPIVSASINDNGVLTVLDSSGHSSSIFISKFQADPQNKEFTINDDSITLVCFLSGTLIRTPSGDRKVEDLRIGDEVSTFDPQSGITVTKKLRWVGYQKRNIHDMNTTDIDEYPIRICAHTFDENIPSRDLLVTPEHCIFIDNALIPARMLVNDHNIYYDKNIDNFIVHHIETEDHSIVWSENLLTETYLDTGNRSRFSQPGLMMKVDEVNRCWERDAAAPLDTSRERVEPLFAKIIKRAGIPTKYKYTTCCPEVVVISPDGKIIRPRRVSGDRYIFSVDKNIDFFWLTSRSSRPSDVIGPFVDDRRSLGVLVKNISIFGSSGYVSIDSVDELFDSEKAVGWYDTVSRFPAWTNGKAKIPVSIHGDNCSFSAADNNVIVSIEIEEVSSYVCDQANNSYKLSNTSFTLTSIL